MAIAFSVMLARKDSSSLDAGGEVPTNLIYPFTDAAMALLISAILEWVIGFAFNLYLLTFWYDLRLAAPKDDIHRELKDGGVAAQRGPTNSWWQV